MKVTIELPPDTPKEAVIKLKEFLDRAEIVGMERTEIKRAPHAEGQMGTGTLLNAVTTFVSAATDSLIQLVTHLQKYVDRYRTRLMIPTQNGNVILEHGNPMKPDQIQKLVVAIQQNDK